MSLQRNLFFVLIALTLSSCGFQPFYAKQTLGSSARVPFDVGVEPIALGRTGQILQNELQHLFNPLSQDVPQEYVLSVDLEEKISPLVIERDRTVSRYNLVYKARYSLKDPRSGKVINRGVSKVVGSYDAVESDFATYAAQKDTSERAMVELAKDIKVRLMAFLLKHREAQNEDSGR
jgi:LPS-assembly lipoprotein